MLFHFLDKAPNSFTSKLAGPYGHHHVPYPVELPNWLPEQVINNMLDFFRPILVDLLNSMEDAAPIMFPGKVHRSQESESNISAASTNADPLTHTIEDYLARGETLRQNT
jgi:hypothetical protein